MVGYNGTNIPSSSRYDNLAELVERLDRISVEGVYRTPEIIRGGLFTAEFAADKRIIYSKGGYLGAQVVNHFLERNDIDQQRYPRTVNYKPLSDFLGIGINDIIVSVGALLRDGVLVLEKGKISIPYIYDLYIKSAENIQHQAILKYIPWVKFLATRIAAKLPFNVLREDLVSAGVLGLIDALGKFDVLRDVEFKTYAKIRVNGAMKDYLRTMDLAPRSVRILERRVNEATQYLEGELSRIPTEEEIAVRLDVDLERLVKMKQLSGFSIIPLIEIRRDGEESAVDVADIFNDKLPLNMLMRKEETSLLSEALKTLTPNQQSVISMYYYEDIKMKAIGKVMNLTESRVSQLHTEAVFKLRWYFKRRMN